MIKKYVFAMAFLAASTVSNALAHACYTINAPIINFGIYHPEAPHDMDMDTTIDIYCAPAFQGKELNVRVNLIGKVGPGEQRTLINTKNKDQAYFVLYRDAARTIPLSDQMTIPIAEASSTSRVFTIRLYGKFFAKQDISAGVYIGNVILNIDF